MSSGIIVFQDQTFHLFVYGSLKEGGFLHHKLKPFIEISFGRAFCNGELYKSSYGNWPVLSINDRGSVEGELYLVKSECWGLLIEEEVEAGYSILRVKIEFGNNEKILAYCCVWEREVDSKNYIPEGFWVV